MNSIHFFVSSTFEDMHAERDAIQLRVLPMLFRYAGEYGHTVDFRDLRWGINTQDEKEEDKSGKVIKVCFEEIKKCRPYMIVLLGERYGSIPDAALLPQILREMNNRSDRHFTEDEVAGKSYTELEILYGPLSDDETLSRTLFLFREPMEGAPDRFRADGEEGASRMADLKARLTKVLAEKFPNESHIMTYTMSWNEAEGCVDQGAVEAFSKQLEDRLKEMIAPRFAAWQTLPEYEKIYRRQMAFATEKAKRFSAEEQLTLCEKALDKRVRKLYITGKEGSGKTTLAAKMTLTLREKGHPVCAAFDRVSLDTSAFENPFEAICEYYAAYTEALLREKGYPAENSEENPYRRLKKILAQYDSHPELPKLYFMTELSTALFKKDGVWSSDPFDGRFENIVFLYTIELREGKDFNDTAYISAELPRPTGDILKALLESIDKELPYAVLSTIITRHGDKSPLYYALLVKRLMLIDGSDLARAAENATLRSASGDDKLLWLEMNLVEGLPEDEFGLGCQLWEDAKVRLGRELLDAIGGFVSLFREGLTRKELIRLVTGMGVCWNEVSYSILLNYFDELITENDEGRVIFASHLAEEVIPHGLDLTPYYRAALDYLQSERELLDTRLGCRQYLAAAEALEDKTAIVDAIRGVYGDIRIPLAQEMLRNNPRFVLSVYRDKSLVLTDADLDFFVYRLWNLRKAAEYNRSGAEKLFTVAVGLAECYGNNTYLGWAYYHLGNWIGTDKRLEYCKKAAALLLKEDCLKENLIDYADLMLNMVLAANYGGQDTLAETVLEKLIKQKEEILAAYSTEWGRGDFLFGLADCMKEYHGKFDKAYPPLLSEKSCRILYEEAFDRYSAYRDLTPLISGDCSYFLDTLDEVLWHMECAFFDDKEKRALAEKNLPILEAVFVKREGSRESLRKYYGYLIGYLMLISPEEEGADAYLSRLLAHFKENPNGNGYRDDIFRFYRLLLQYNKGAELVSLALSHIKQLQIVPLETDFPHHRRIRLIKAYGYLLKGALATENYNLVWRLAFPYAEELMLLHRHREAYEVSERKSDAWVNELWQALPKAYAKADDPSAYLLLCILQDLSSATSWLFEEMMEASLQAAYEAEARRGYDSEYEDRIFRFVGNQLLPKMKSPLWQWKYRCLGAYILLEEGNYREAKKTLAVLKRMQGRLQKTLDEESYANAMAQYAALIKRLS